MPRESELVIQAGHSLKGELRRTDHQIDIMQPVAPAYAQCFVVWNAGNTYAKLPGTTGKSWKEFCFSKDDPPEPPQPVVAI